MNASRFRVREKDSLGVVTLILGLLLLGYFGASYQAYASTPVTLMPVPKPQYFDQTGLPLAFGCVFTYQIGTTTPLATYTDNTGTVQNTNPVILSAGGTSSIWIQAGQAYTVKVYSAGGTNCASGTLQYTVDGIGGGVTQLTTVVTYSSTPTFNDASQNQLFQITLTGNATSQPLTAAGVIPPGLVTWQITQDGVGGHTFSWPANTVGGATICSAANCVTQQEFLWNGTNATAVGPAVYSTAAEAVPNLFDFGLSASSPACTDANKQFTSSCNSVFAIIVNGQTINPGGSGNVNNGAAAHSLATNEGNGQPLGGVTLGAHQTAIGQSGADPAPTTIPNCPDSSGNHLNYTQSGDTYSCGTSSAGAAIVKAKVNTTSCGLVANGGEWNCTGTINWGVTLSTTTYYADCALSVPQPPGTYTIPAGFDAHFFWNSKTTTTMTYAINDDHSGSNGAQYNLSCVAME